MRRLTSIDLELYDFINVHSNIDRWSLTFYLEMPDEIRGTSEPQTSCTSEHHTHLERYERHISSSPVPDRTPSEDEVNQAPQTTAGCSPKRNNATTWTLRRHTGTVLICSELREHTDPPIDYTRLKHLIEALFKCIGLNQIELNWTELNWTELIWR